jgi:hypothetical protein
MDALTPIGMMQWAVAAFVVTLCVAGIVGLLVGLVIGIRKTWREHGRTTQI